MAKVKLDVATEKLPILLNILENLKTGIINNIEVEKSLKIKPVSSSIEGNSSKRYLSKEAYKKRLQQKVDEDEFLPKGISTSKYITPEEFKRKIKGK